MPSFVSVNATLLLMHTTRCDLYCSFYNLFYIYCNSKMRFAMYFFYKGYSVCFRHPVFPFPSHLPPSLSSTSLLSSSALIKHLITGPGGWGIMRLGLYMFTHSDLHWAFPVFLCLTHISSYPSFVFLLFMSPVVPLGLYPSLFIRLPFAAVLMRIYIVN